VLRTQNIDRKCSSDRRRPSTLHQPEIWKDKLTFLWKCHTSRKRDKTNEDGTFVKHNTGAASGKFTSDWYLQERESRDELGEWQKTSVSFPRFLQSITPVATNSWVRKISKGKESDKYHVCKPL
jgi:hypothetical protein